MSEWSGRPEVAFLVGPEEDRFTTYLAELLKERALLRRFLAELCEITVEDEQHLPSVRTQVTASGGRADLVLRRNPQLYVLFEAKVGAWFHEGQLSTYARELTDWREGAPDGQAVLALLCPARSLPAALEQAKGEIGDASPPLRLMGLSWEQVAGFCREARESVKSERLAFHLGEFARIVQWRLGKELRPFTEEEARLLVDPLAGLVIEKAQRLLELIAGEVGQILGDDGTTTASSGKGYDGFWLHAKGRRWWFGLWYDKWAQSGTPLLFQLNGWAGRPKPPVPERLPSPIEITHAGGEQWVLPLPVPAGVELAATAKTCAAWISQVVNELPDSGAPA